MAKQLVGSTNIEEPVDLTGDFVGYFSILQDLRSALSPAPPQSFWETISRSYESGEQKVIEMLGGGIGAILGLGKEKTESLVGKIAPEPVDVGVPQRIEEVVKLPFKDAAPAFGKLVASWIAEQVPILGTSVAGGALGAAVGGPIGAALGATLASYLLNVGDTYLELLEKGVDSHNAARLAGIPMAILDAITPVRMATGGVKLVLKKGASEAAKKDPAGFLRRLASEVATSAAIEGTTEAAQRGVQETAYAITGVPNAPRDVALNIVNEALAGAFVGGAFGVGTGLAKGLEEQQIEPKEPIVRGIVEPSLQTSAVEPQPQAPAPSPQPQAPVVSVEPQTEAQRQLELPLESGSYTEDSLYKDIVNFDVSPDVFRDKATQWLEKEQIERVISSLKEWAKRGLEQATDEESLKYREVLARMQQAFPAHFQSVRFNNSTEAEMAKTFGPQPPNAQVVTPKPSTAQVKDPVVRVGLGLPVVDVESGVFSIEGVQEADTAEVEELQRLINEAIEGDWRRTNPGSWDSLVERIDDSIKSLPHRPVDFARRLRGVLGSVPELKDRSDAAANYIAYIEELPRAFYYRVWEAFADLTSRKSIEAKLESLRESIRTAPDRLEAVRRRANYVSSEAYAILNFGTKEKKALDRLMEERNRVIESWADTGFGGSLSLAWEIAEMDVAISKLWKERGVPDIPVVELPRTIVFFPPSVNNYGWILDYSTYHKSSELRSTRIYTFEGTVADLRDPQVLDSVKEYAARIFKVEGDPPGIMVEAVLSLLGYKGAIAKDSKGREFLYLVDGYYSAAGRGFGIYEDLTGTGALAVLATEWSDIAIEPFTLTVDGSGVAFAPLYSADELATYPEMRAESYEDIAKKHADTIAKLESILTRTARRVADVLATVPSLGGISNPFVDLQDRLIKAIPIFTYDYYGIAIYTSVDGYKMMIGINPVLLSNRGYIDTVIHELTHSLGVHSAQVFSSNPEDTFMSKYMVPLTRMILDDENLYDEIDKIATDLNTEIIDLAEEIVNLWEDFDARTDEIYQRQAGADAGKFKPDPEIDYPLQELVERAKKGEKVDLDSFLTELGRLGSKAFRRLEKRFGPGASASVQRAPKPKARGVRKTARDKGDWGPSIPEYEGVRRRISYKPYGERLFDSIEGRGDIDVDDLPVNAKLVGLSWTKRRRMKQGIDRFNRALGYVVGLRQLGIMFPNFEPLKQYIDTITKGFFHTKTSILAEGDAILKDWSKLGRKKNEQLTELIFSAMEESFDKNRKLDQQEIGKIATDIGAGKDVVDFYYRIDGFFQGILNLLRQALLKEVQRTFPAGSFELFTAELEVESEINRLRDRNYFPAVRFGRWTVVAKAKKDISIKGREYKKGQVIYFSASETEKLRNKDYEEAMELLGSQGLSHGEDFELHKDWLPDHVESFLSFPPTLYDQLVKHLNLTPEQQEAARQYMYQLAPGMGFAKRMLRKKGIAGYSYDARRAFASYVQSAANHMARLQWRGDLEAIISDAKKEIQKLKDRTKARQILEVMTRHFEDMMNPVIAFDAIKGAMWVMFFSLVPKQAIMNLTEVPLFTYPYLAKRFGFKFGTGDGKVKKHLVRAYGDALGFRKLDGDTNAMLDELRRDGLTDQSFASEVGALSSGGLAAKYFARTEVGHVWRQFVEYSTSLFSIAERYNRRVTAIAAYRLARDLGYGHEEAVEEARRAVVVAMGDYSQVNRPELMRDVYGRHRGSLPNKRSIFFIFRMFQQKSLFFALRGEGGFGFLIMLIAFAGLKGLPFAEDLIPLFDFLITAVRKKKFDIEKEIQGMFNSIFDWINAGDFLMNGASRSSFGLTALDTLFGLPIPAVDMSASVQMGRIINIEPILAAMQGFEDKDRAMLDFATSIFGVFPSSTINLSRAALRDSPSDLKWLNAIPIAGFKNIMKFTQGLVSREITDAKGTKLIDFDLRDSRHIGELVSVLMGAPPTRLSRRLDALNSAHDFVRYHMAVRQALMAKAALAYYRQDKEEIAEAIERVREYNRRVVKDKDLKPFAITTDQIRDSIKTQVKDRLLHEIALPPQKRYIETYMKILRAYGIESTPSQIRPLSEPNRPEQSPQ